MNCMTMVVTVCLAVGLTATSAWADFKRERALKLEPGASFVLETDIGSVVLTGESAPGARVVVTSDIDLDRDFDFTFEETARGAKVTIKRRGMRRLFSGWFGNHDTRIAIQVPTRTDVRLDTSGGSIRTSHVTGVVGVHTSGGSLEIDAIEGNVDGSTSGGGIVMTDIRGSLRATTSGGGITIDGVAGDLRASTSGGGVDVRGAGGRVDASSSGGGVTVRFAPGNSRGGELSSSGGSVRTELDPGAKVSIDATASGGGVNTDLPITIQGKIERGSLRGDMNGGGPTLRLRSSGGGVRITGTSRSASR